MNRNGISRHPDSHGSHTEEQWCPTPAAEGLRYQPDPGEGMRKRLQCCRRYPKANNKQLNRYVRSRKSNYLVYLDTYNLFGCAMSQPLPTVNFRWLRNNDILVQNAPDDDPKGYILEVDLRYPKELHEKYSDFPSVPENRVPSESQQTKLLTILYNKERYVFHYHNPTK